MKIIHCLEDHDSPRDFDFCRPLGFSLAKQECTPEGHAINHLKWAPVHRTLPKTVNSMTVGQLRELGINYEFIRGEVPKANRLNMDLYPNTRPL